MVVRKFNTLLFKTKRGTETTNSKKILSLVLKRNQCDIHNDFGTCLRVTRTPFGPHSVIRDVVEEPISLSLFPLFLMNL